MKKTTVGIDLGTTYSLVALVQDGAPIVLENSLGELLTPSVVGLSDTGEILVGAPAQARLTTHPELTASVFKRTMGTDASYTLGARQFRSEELSALVLKTLREDAEKFLGRPIDEAVVTVPAYFGELQRRATRDACEIAGIHVERIINEPTAAALAFGLHQKDRELKAIVLDLGGGTFDVTALEILEGVVEIQSSAGDSRLGGEDFTEALAEWVERAVTAAGGARPAKGVPQARLRAAAEAAKKSLSAGQTAKMALFGLALQDGRTIDWEGEVTREQAEVAWAPLLTRLEAPIRRALADARWNSDVDEILLVGGATRMPVISSLAARLFGRLPQKHLPPDEAVAWGAAIQASLKAGDGAVEDLVVTDVAPFSLGISVVEKVGTRQVEGIFLPILERGTVLPASRIERVSTVSDNQREIVVQIYQGEHSHCSSNQKLGEYRVQGIPRASGGQESIDIRLTYDLNGVLEVESTITSTGKVATLVIERSPGRLSASQIDEARRAMARLKFHPKDALPNKTALGRADALYVEATGELRAALGQAISSFRADLETQDPDRIHEGKENLLRVCSEVRRLLGRTDMF